MGHRRAALWAGVFFLGAAAPAFAQDVPPQLNLSPVTEQAEVSTSAVDLENLVTSAAKTLTTVQETPAIVTVVTADEIRQWGYRTLQDVMADLPGWARYDTEGGTVPTMTTRGVVQAMLPLHDGIPTLDPYANFQVMNRSIPLESIKRIEVVTGPG